MPPILSFLVPNIISNNHFLRKVSQTLINIGFQQINPIGINTHNKTGITIATTHTPNSTLINFKNFISSSSLSNIILEYG